VQHCVGRDDRQRDVHVDRARRAEEQRGPERRRSEERLSPRDVEQEEPDRDGARADQAGHEPACDKPVLA
jgi:hypothetical protein